MPEDVEEVAVALAAFSSPSPLVEGVLLIKLDKLLSQIGLADSVSDAVRKIKQKAVRVNGELKTDPKLPWSLKDLDEPRSAPDLGGDHALRIDGFEFANTRGTLTTLSLFNNRQAVSTPLYARRNLVMSNKTKGVQTEWNLGAAAGEQCG